MKVQDALVSFEQMVQIERTAMEQMGISQAILMENAGAGVGRLALDKLQEISGGGGGESSRMGRVAVVIGPGNNGGDGLVALRHLATHGIQVRGFIFSRKAFHGSSLDNLRMAESLGLFLADWPECPWDDPLRDWNVGKGDVVVDALFGTGISRAPTDRAAHMLKAMDDAKARGAFVLSVDVPSGLSDQGPFSGSVSASTTACLGALKSPLFTGDGADLSGEVTLVDLGLPLSGLQTVASVSARLVRPSDGSELIPVRRRGFHKGEAGHVVVVTGALDQSGAAGLACLGALKSGAGLVTAVGRSDAVRAIQSQRLEVMGQAVTGSGAFSFSDVPQFVSLTQNKDCLVVGPGLERSDDTLGFLRTLLKEIHLKSVVLDADALNALSESPSLADDLRQSASPLVLTPHPLEMARLVHATVAEVQRDRIGAAKALSQQSGATVVLKEKGTVVASVDGDVAVVSSGCAGMATAGMGDVLSGVVAALCAQANSLKDGVVAGVLAHGLAGELAARQMGNLGLTASDVALALGLVWRQWER